METQIINNCCCKLLSFEVICYTTNTSLDTEKAHEEIQHPFVIKILNKLGVEGSFLDLIKDIHEKPIGNIILNSERLNALP